MTYKINSSFENLLKHIKDLPLWIKQGVYAEIKQDLEASHARVTLDFIKADDSLPLYQPHLSFIGVKEIETKSRKLHPEVYSLLDGAQHHHMIMEICINNGWNLEFCSVQLNSCLEMELITCPKSQVLSGTIQFIAGKIRLGEYLIKLNKISIEQLDQALRTQKYIESSLDEKTGLADVLINLGCISKNDTDGILFIKEESKKEYIPHDTNLYDDADVAAGEFKRISRENIEYKQVIEKLNMENVQLREQLKKFLHLK